MTPPAEPTPTGPPTDRPTKLRWGCVSLVFFGSVLVFLPFIPLSGSRGGCGPLTGSTLQASGIFKAMMLYALDHDGEFPTGTTNSNQAFRQLFPDCMEGERSFLVPNSAWHDAAPGKRPDGDIGSAPGFSKCLERGENHWAYVSGLDTKSPGNLPVIADGFVENQIGTYTDQQTKKGGVWKGTRAIVVFADGSAKQFPLKAKTRFRVLLRDPKTGKPVDIFTREGGLPDSARVLNPE